MPYFRNEEINLLLIHIPKTGGTSLEDYFSKKYNIPLDNKSLYWFNKMYKNVSVNSSLQHITYSEIIKYNDFFNVEINNALTISIVRNPYKRMISDLFWKGIIHMNYTKEQVTKCLQNYLYDKDCDNHNLPQYLFVTDQNKKLFPHIKILRTETLVQDMHNMGFKDFNVKSNYNHNKVNNKINYNDYLNRESIKLINEFYHDDFILFGYEKINPEYIEEPKPEPVPKSLPEVITPIQEPELENTSIL